MKKWKKGMLVCLIVVLVLGVGATGVFEFYVKPKYVKPLMETAAKFFESEEEWQEMATILQQELQNGDLSDFIKDVEGQDIGQGAVQGKNTSINSGSKASADSKSTKTTEQHIGENGSATKPKSEGMSIGDLEKQISLKDKAEGLMIATKLNTPYLMGLTKDGLTNQDKEDAKEHLREALTTEEYEKLKILVVKYAHLLNNE